MRAARPPLRAVIRYTRNFEANLTRIEAYWSDNGFPQGYDRLLEEIGERVIANLEQHPRMGGHFGRARRMRLKCCAGSRLCTHATVPTLMFANT